MLVGVAGSLDRQPRTERRPRPGRPPARQQPTDRRGTGGRRRAEDDQELLPSEASDAVSAADGVAQVAADVLEHLVARLVAVRVVDLLEVVEVEEHHDVPVAERVEQEVSPAPVAEAGEVVGQVAAARIATASRWPSWAVRTATSLRAIVTPTSIATGSATAVACRLVFVTGTPKA